MPSFLTVIHMSPLKRMVAMDKLREATNKNWMPQIMRCLSADAPVSVEKGNHVSTMFYTCRCALWHDKSECARRSHAPRVHSLSSDSECSARCTTRVVKKPPDAFVRLTTNGIRIRTRSGVYVWTRLSEILLNV
jgi:hypothetical protein